MVIIVNPHIIPESEIISMCQENEFVIRTRVRAYKYHCINVRKKRAFHDDYVEIA